MNSFIHHTPGPLAVWIISLIAKLIPVILGVVNLANDIPSNFYYFDFAYNLSSVVSTLITVSDWAFDLQLIRPVKPWNRYDPHLVMPHLHEQNQTGYTFTVPAAIRTMPLDLITCDLLRFKWCDEYEKMIRQVWVGDKGQDVIHYPDDWEKEYQEAMGEKHLHI